MRKFVCAVVIALLLFNVLGISSCEKNSDTVILPQEESGPVTIPEKGCKIEFPKRQPYEYEMDLTLDTDSNTIGGHVVIDFYNDSSDPWEELCLRDYPSLFDSPSVYANKQKNGGGITEISNVRDSRGGKLEVEREKDDVLMAILPTKDYYLLRDGIKKIDKEAFFIITDTYEVFGGE